MAKSRVKKSLETVLGIAVPTAGAILIITGFLDLFPELTPFAKVLVGSAIILVAIPLLNKLGFRIGK